MIRFTCLFVVAASLAGRLPAQEDKAPSPHEPKTVQLTLSPAGEPKPALRYVLLPPLIDRKPGNAAQLYMKCMLRFSQQDQQVFAKWDDWANMPLDQLLTELRQDKTQWREFLHEVDTAARRDHCDWELAVRDGKFYELPLPEVQNIRLLGRLVAVRTRLAIAEGKYDEAEHSLQTGYAMSRHVAEGQTLINALVGIAIAGMMNEQLTTLIQQSDAPDLYWALTSLPQPFISTLKGIDAERDAIALSYPILGDLDSKYRSGREWEAALNEITHDLAHEMSYYVGNDRVTGDKLPSMQTVWNTGLALAGYTRAKEALIAGGRGVAEVEAMPVGQVVAVFTMERYHELRDDLIRWHYVPYWQARTGMDEAEARLAANNDEIIPLAKVTLPALKASMFATARLDRQFGMLRTIEALRLYAKKHDGVWPPDLAAVTEVPLPLDSTTGQPFRYRLDGESAILESPSPPGMQPLTGGLRYVLKRAAK